MDIPGWEVAAWLVPTPVSTAWPSEEPCPLALLTPAACYASS